LGDHHAWSESRSYTWPDRTAYARSQGYADQIGREAARRFSGGEGLIFPSVTGKPLSDATLSKLLREQGIRAVPHGFRSSFRDWCGETGQPREVAEACLAHTVKSKVEAAYARSDLLNRRRFLMQDWADYLSDDARTCVFVESGCDSRDHARTRALLLTDAEYAATAGMR